MKNKISVKTANNTLHVIELENEKGVVFAHFNSFSDYENYMADLIADFNGLDCQLEFNFKTWFCYLINGEIRSFENPQFN